MRKYVHRVGRTARAGKEGDAWSLVEEQEVRRLGASDGLKQGGVELTTRCLTQVAPFRSIMSKAQHYDKIERVRVKDQVVDPFVPAYQGALERLRTFYATTRDREQ